MHGSFGVDFNMQKIEKETREKRKLLPSYFTVQTREKLSLRATEVSVLEFVCEISPLSLSKKKKNK